MNRREEKLHFRFALTFRVVAIGRFAKICHLLEETFWPKLGNLVQFGRKSLPFENADRCLCKETESKM